MKQFNDDNGQEYGFDIGDAHFFADEEMTIELPAGTFTNEQIAQIMGGVPIIRCKDCKYKYTDGDNVVANYCLLNHNRVQPDEWFCADAEREEE